jgi:predicted secreted protein
MSRLLKNKSLLWGIILLIALPLILGACSTSDAATPTTQAITDGASARDAALDYLNGQYNSNVPGKDISWQEEDKTPPDILGSVTKSYASGDWTILVSYPVVKPDLTVYKVILRNSASGWHWEGSVKADGTVTETSPLKQITEEESRQIAEAFVKNCPTFVFDGMADTLKYVDVVVLRTPYAWQYSFQFESRHAGYGNRTGQMVAEVITPHEAVVTVINGQVVSATLDTQWDMLEQQIINQPGDNPNPNVPPLDDGTTSVQIELTYDELMNQKHITKEVEVELPGSLVVTLASNPSTGFQWQEAKISDEMVLAEYSHQFVEPQGDLVGAAGKDVWTFKTLEKGTSTLQFEYSRPWEGGEQAEWTVELTVVVK